MRAAPPVQVVVEPGVAAACVSIVSGLAAAGCAAWLFGLADWPGEWIASAIAAAGAGILSWRGFPSGAQPLAWDGAAWLWQGSTGDVDVMVDVDAWMLLAFSPDDGGRTRWLAVCAGGRAAGWHGLRAAVYSRASTPPR